MFWTSFWPRLPPILGAVLGGAMVLDAPPPLPHPLEERHDADRLPPPRLRPALAGTVGLPTGGHGPADRAAVLRLSAYGVHRPDGLDVRGRDPAASPARRPGRRVRRPLEPALDTDPLGRSAGRGLTPAPPGACARPHLAGLWRCLGAVHHRPLLRAC